MIKYSFYYLLISVLISCNSPSKEEILISDYVQTKKNVKTDLNFKLKSYEILDEKITVRDSLKHYFDKYLETDQYKRLTGVQEVPTNLTDQDIDKILTSVEDIVSRMNSHISNNKQKLDSLKTAFEILEKKGEDLSDAFQRFSNLTDQRSNLAFQRINTEDIFSHGEIVDRSSNLLTYANDLLSNKDSILVHKVKAKYQINNPMLNGAEQEISKVFLFDSKMTKIFGVD